MPEVLEAGRRQFGIAHRVLDVAVPEVSLQRASIDAVIGELEATGVSQHVRVHWETESGCNAKPRDHLAKARRRERRAALGRKDKRRRWVLVALEPT